MVAGALLLHGLGHGIVLIAHLVMNGRAQPTESGWRAAQSWALPHLTPTAATTLSTVLCALALTSFAAAALGIWRRGVPRRAWRPLAVAGALVSLLGIIVFLPTWAPAANTIAAISADVAVLVALLVFRWPPEHLLHDNPSPPDRTTS